MKRRVVSTVPTKQVTETLDGTAGCNHAVLRVGQVIAPLFGLLAIVVGLGSLLRPPSIGFRGAGQVPLAELKDRVTRIRTSMSAYNLDALVLFADEYRPGHGTYLTLFKPMNMIEESPQVIVITNKSTTLAVGRLNSFAAKDTVWISDQQYVPDIPAWLPERLAGAKLIGLVGDNVLPLSRYNQIVNAAPSAVFVPSTDLLTEMRQVKTAIEIENMEAAARLDDEVLRYVLRWIRVGMTEMQVAALAEYAGRSMGADFGSATVIMSGPNTQYAAWRPSLRVIERGDLVMVDFNPTIYQYANDGGITLLMPGAAPELKNALLAAHSVLKEVIRRLQPYTKASSVFDIMLAELDSRGYGENFEPWARLRQGVGHGVGIDVVEPPFLNAQSSFDLLPGMTLAIKLDLHSIQGRNGLRVESVVLITEHGARALNRLVVDSPDDVAVLRASGPLGWRCLSGLIVAACAAVRYILQQFCLPSFADHWRASWWVWLHMLPMVLLTAGAELSNISSILSDPEVVKLLLLGGCLNLIAQGLFAGELRHCRQGTAQALSITPALMAITSILVLGEPPTPIATILAPLLVVVGVVETGFLWGSKATYNPWWLLGIASLWSASATCDALGVHRTTPKSWALLQCLFLVVATPVVLWIRGVSLCSTEQRWSWRCAAVAFAFLAETIAQNTAVCEAPAADVMALKRISVFLIPTLPSMVHSCFGGPGMQIELESSDIADKIGNKPAVLVENKYTCSPDIPEQKLSTA